MRKFISFLTIAVLIVIGVYTIMERDGFTKEFVKFETYEESPKLKSDETSEDTNQLVKGDLFAYIGKASNYLIDQYGEPIRKDLTPYGYTWWIYTDKQTNVIQYGIENDQIQTIFATGERLQSEPFSIGKTYKEIEKEFPFKEKVTYQKGLSFYSFMLNETDIATNPLVKLSDDTFIQLYFDTFTDRLSSIRIISGETLLKQRFYEMEYRGSLPETPSLMEEDWEKIERGMEKQIFDITNIYRYRHGLAPLVNNEQVSKVAYLHSKDMNDHNYFSHYSEDGHGLKERLEKGEVYYVSAGENIAAQHTDGPAAVEGWLNSEGHREAMFNEAYSHLGVGVHRFYYTQNFLLKP